MSKQPPQPEPDERALFDEAMADVQPLERDRHLPKISFRRPVTISEHEREVLRRRLERPPECVLDVGCGTGEILRRFRDDFAPRRIVGLDLFPGHMRRAPRPVVLGDGFRTPFPDRTFDLVLVRHLLQALPDPPALLREARRLLRPGGRLHLLVEDYAVMGASAHVHQFCRVGESAMVGAMAGISQDVAPFTIAEGSRARLLSINRINMERRGFPPERIRAVERAYRLLFRSGLRPYEAFARVRAELADSRDAEHMVAFLEKSERGFCRVR